MKEAKNLLEYVANYLQYEVEESNYDYIDQELIYELVEMAIDAYEGGAR